jgi:spore coat protein U-like protein
MKNLNKFIGSLAAAVVLASVVPSASAATANSNFNVTVALTATCEITSAPTDVAFTYTSFQGGNATSSGGAFGVRCTNSLPYSMSLDSTSGTVIGLNYSLSLSANSGTGNGATQNYTVNGTMASGQSGTCVTSPDVSTCSGSQQRTLTITY